MDQQKNESKIAEIKTARLSISEGRAPGVWKPHYSHTLSGLGCHDFRVIDVSFGFGEGGSVEHLECRRCGLVTRHQA